MGNLVYRACNTWVGEAPLAQALGPTCIGIRGGRWLHPSRTLEGVEKGASATSQRQWLLAQHPVDDRRRLVISVNSDFAAGWRCECDEVCIT
jgi:hypothetical protein